MELDAHQGKHLLLSLLLLPFLFLLRILFMHTLILLHPHLLYPFLLGNLVHYFLIDILKGVRSVIVPIFLLQHRLKNVFD